MFFRIKLLVIDDSMLAIVSSPKAKPTDLFVASSGSFTNEITISEEFLLLLNE